MKYFSRIAEMEKITTSCDTIEVIEETGFAVNEYLLKNLLLFQELENLIGIKLENIISDLGLRIRPFLMFISSKENGFDLKKILPIASGIEMIQLSTLVIDDILDESNLRNNKPSIFSQRGTKETISIGTILSSIGFELIAKGFELNPELKNQSYVIKILAQTHTKIYLGQIQDLQFEGNTSVSEEQYLKMIFNTTGCFIRSSLVAGALLWDAPKEIIDNLKNLGYALGMAYQIRDDVIDIIGDPECTGKPLGGDLLRCKMRLPVIHALKKLNGEKRIKLESLLQSKKLDNESLDEALHLLKETDAADYCISKTREFCEQALFSIDLLPEKHQTLKTYLKDVTRLVSTFN